MLISLIVDLLIYFAICLLIVSFFLHRRFLRQIGVENLFDFENYQRAQKKLKASENKFRTIFENSAIAITLIDHQERIIAWNTRTEQLLGMTKQDLYLRPVRSLYPHVEWSKIRSLNIRRTGSWQHLETFMIRKDHRLIEVDISISVLKDEQGGFLGSIGVIQDITDRKEAERKREESEQRFRTIFNYSPAAITLTDQNERIISWNPQAERLLGKSKEDLYLKPIQILYEPQEWKRIRQLGLRYKGPQHHFESKIVRKDGSLLDVDVSVTVFKDDQGRITGSLGILVDITSRKKNEQELRQANEDLRANERALRSLYRDLQKVQNNLLEKQRELAREHQEQIRLREEAETATKAKSIFLSNMSHEIRTPLNSILGFSQLLQKTTQEEKPRKFIDIIESNSQHLLAIINDLLDFERAISGRMTLEEKAIDLRVLIQEIFSLLESQINERPIQMSFSVNEEIPHHLFGDEVKIRQILVNLLSNALKFTDEGFIHLCVGCEKVFAAPWAQVHVVSFRVSDSGIGMDQKSLNNIFEQFTQADNTITRKYGGTGLGLSICKAYAELMKGDIRVESKLGSGSSFIFTLPMADKGFTQEELRTFLKNNQDIFTGDRILIVEPNTSLRGQLKKILEDMYCVCDAVSSGEEAIVCLKEKRYCICFLNIELPRTGGISIVKMIRDQIDKQIPLIAMGETTFFQKKNHCLEAGMNDFLHIPFLIDDIAQKLFIHLRKDKFKNYSPKSSK